MLASSADPGSPAAAPLELRGVSKRYGSLVALDGIDLVLRRGETTVLIGSSGCGKSTLLRVVLRLVRPDAGEVRFQGSPVQDHDVVELRRRMGYVIQEGGLFPHLTVEENVGLMPRHLRWAPARIRERIRALADRVRLPASVLERYPLQLSGGQRQRVGLMRALVLDPEVLLFDEPLGALDPIIRADLQEDLRGLFRELSKTVVWVTHDLSEAAFFGDQVVLMRAGIVVQQGRFGDLVERPTDAYVERFVRAQRPVWQPAP